MIIANTSKPLKQKLRDFNIFSIKVYNARLISLALVVTFFITLMLLMSYFNRPISDDYLFHRMNESKTFIEMGIDGYVHGNGRFGQYFLFSIYDHIFGLRYAVMMAPIINTIILSMSTSYLIFVVGVSLKKQQKLWEVGLLGTLLAFVMILSARSIFDSSLWLDSSVVYIPSIATVTLETALILQLLFIDKRLSWKKLLLLFFLILVGRQFSEPTSAFMIASYALTLLGAIIKKHKFAIKVLAISFISSVAGFLILFFSPGSQTRQSNYESKLDLFQMLIGSLGYFKYSIDIIFSWRFWLYFFLGIIMFIYLKSFLELKRNKLFMSFLGIYLIFVPYYCLFVVSEYSLSGYIALRTYQVPAALAGVGISFIIAIFISLLIEKHSNSYKLLPYIIYAFAIMAIITSFRPLSNIIKATSIRSVQYDYRELSIANQKIAGKNEIIVYPAPILLEDAEPGEFLYRDSGQIDWFEESFKIYYGIDEKKLVVVNEQITPYCLPNQDMPWWNIEECQQLNLKNQ